MKWLKALFQNSDKDIQEGDTIVTPSPVIHDVRIGEPIFEFAKCVKENPKRFRLQKMKRKTGQRLTTKYYTFTDKLTSESWGVVLDPRWSSEIYGEKIEWMTTYECKYIAHAIAEIYQTRADRFLEIKNNRSKRKKMDERKRLMGVYCNGINT